jgi:translation initiation factor IF-2
LTVEYFGGASMGKIRVYNLAHELDMDSKEIIDILNDLDIEVSSHMSTITDETAELVKEMYNSDTSPGAEETIEQEQTVEDAKPEAVEQDNSVQAAEEVEAKEDIIEIETPIKVKEFA